VLCIGLGEVVADSLAPDRQVDARSWLSARFPEQLAHVQHVGAEEDVPDCVI
jgi:hypothetical protein